ncbi:MAG TPA: hypothetical protein VF571_05390 [Pyrinomonadaceae bacterium]
MQEVFAGGVLFGTNCRVCGSKEAEAFYMAKFTNPLANVRVASPCPANWDEMVGDDRKRFCGQCKLNVYNLSGMGRDEAENLLLNAEGRLCVRFYRRTDGTVLTQDCPVGWKALKRKVSRTATAAFSFVVGLFGGLGFGAAFNSEQKATMGTMPVVPITREISEEPVIMGGATVVEVPEATMGQMITEPKQVIGKAVIPQKKAPKPKR